MFKTSAQRADPEKSRANLFRAMLRQAGLAVFVIVFSLQMFVVQAGVAADSADAFEKKRRAMVTDQLVARGIEDKMVLKAMSEVPRHLFMPKKLSSRAYGDFPLPIGHGQTISQPYIVAYMTEIVRPHSSQRVLEVGTGSGYQAAVLAEVIDEVYTVEIVSELAAAAKNRLLKLGYTRVKSRQGDGYHGWPEAGPFDAIVVTAAAEFIPPPLIEQLKEGGRMIIPVGSPFYLQHLVLVEKKDGEVTTRRLMPVRFVPFRRAQ